MKNLLAISILLLAGCDDPLYRGKVKDVFIEFHAGNTRMVCKLIENYNCGPTVKCDDGEVYNCVSNYIWKDLR